MDLITKVYEGDVAATDTFIDSLFDTNAEGALTIIQDAHTIISATEQNEKQEFALLLLESFWNFFLAQITIFQKADWVNGLEQIGLAHQGFEKLKLIDLEGLTAGFQLYYSAIIDIQSMNMSTGLEKMKEAKAHFEKIDKYGKIYGQQIEAMESESLFISGINLINRLDYENGEIAIERASSLSKNIATKYHDEGSPDYHFFMGLGYQYSALMNFTTQNVKLNGFDFDFFDYSDNEAYENSLKALENLANAIEENEIARMNLNLAKGINLISQVVFELGQCMQALLVGKEENIVFETSALKRKIKNANKFFRSIGEQGLIYIRYGSDMEDRLINVDKFLKYGSKNAIKAKPAVKDITTHTHELVSNGDNEKALDYLIKVYEGYEQYDNIMALKSQHSRLKKDNILGQYTQEKYNVEENKISAAILSLLKTIKAEG